MQAEGEIHGYGWYFRSRGSEWSFEVLGEPQIFYCSGYYDDNQKSGFGASWMPKEKCAEIITACLNLYEIARPDLVGHTIER